MSSIQIALGPRSYKIHFGEEAGRGLRDLLAERIGKGDRVAVITDENVWAALKEGLDGIFPDGCCLMILPPGETTKSMQHLSQVFNFLAESGVDRGSLVVAVGGGVIGDLSGFAAASFMRGIDFVQVPTSLLAMVDSSVGGKTGINIPAGKNLVGAFHQPIGVYSDPRWLGTLPKREFTAGMAEVIKYGLIRDRGLFDELEAEPMLDGSDERLERIVLRCCEIKGLVVEEDERESAATGGRMILNFGHTFGHAIEAVAGYGVFLHGEAVGLGMVLAARLSHRVGLIQAAEAARIAKVIEGHGLPTKLPSKYPVEALLAAMMRDKKWRSFTSKFVVLAAIGTAITRDDVGLDLVSTLLREAGASEVGVVV